MSNEESFPKVHDVEIFTNFDKNIILERTYGWR